MNIAFKCCQIFRIVPKTKETIGLKSSEQIYNFMDRNNKKEITKQVCCDLISCLVSDT